MAAIDAPMVLEPNAYDNLPTGISIALPRAGFEYQVRPLRTCGQERLTVLNSPAFGARYRGEIKAIPDPICSEVHTI